MAHFLSDVTHLRLEHRDHRSSSAAVVPLQKDFTFEAVVRAFACRPALRLDDVRIVTGDLDGGLSLRAGVAGTLVAMIDQKKNVFAYSMVFRPPHLWVGWTDGYISVYDETCNYAKVADLHAHVGTVFALCSQGEHVISGGADWQIYVWHPEKLARVTRGQLSGHQNAVRALVADGDVLFSAGDDFTIRSWDLLALAERAGPWPILEHQSTVRGLALSDVYLFSVSSDGTSRVWNTQTGALVRTLESREMAVTAIGKDEANGYVWTGANDGIIRVWDAASLALVAEIVDHDQTNVAGIGAVGRVNAVKAWSVDMQGTLQVSLCVSDPNEMATVHKVLRGQDDLQPLIEDRRSQLMTNYQLLVQCKERLEQINAAAQAMKGRISTAFSQQHGQRTALTAVQRSRIFLDRVKSHRTNVAAGDVLAAQRDRQIQSQFFSRWLAFKITRYSEKFLARVGERLTMLDQQRLVRCYAAYMALAKRRAVRSGLRAGMSAGLSQLATRTHLQSRFQSWARWTPMKKDSHRSAAAARVITAYTDANLQARTWVVMRQTVARKRTEEQRQTLLNRLAAFFPESQMRFAYQQWSNYLKKVEIRRRARQAVVFLSQACENGTLRAAYRRWLFLGAERRAEKQRRELHDGEEHLAALERELSKSQELTEEGLEIMLKKKQLELALLQSELMETDREITVENHRKRQLQRDILKDASIDESAPKISTLLQMMYLLKARGVNVKAHREIIAATREGLKENTAAELLQKGLAAVRKICAKVIRPQKLLEPGCLDWFIGDLFEKIKKRSILAASVGIVRIVTAFDIINMKNAEAWIVRDSAGNEAWSPEHSYNAELLANYGTLLELAVRAYRIRRGEDPLTGKRLEGKAKKARKFRTAGKLAGKKGGKKKGTGPKKAEGDAPADPATDDKKKKVKKAPAGAATKAPAGTKKKGTGKKKKAKKPAVEGGDAATAPPPADDGSAAEAQPTAAAAVSDEASPAAAPEDSNVGTSVEAPPAASSAPTPAEATTSATVAAAPVATSSEQPPASSPPDVAPATTTTEASTPAATAPVEPAQAPAPATAEAAPASAPTSEPVPAAEAPAPAPAAEPSQPATTAEPAATTDETPAAAAETAPVAPPPTEAAPVSEPAPAAAPAAEEQMEF